MATESAAHRVTTGPAWTPAFIGRHPALLVEWLRLVNGVSRWRRERGRTALFVSLAGAAIAALLAASVSGHAIAAIETLARYWLLASVMSAIYAFTSINRRRRSFDDSQSLSWLIATPISPSSLRWSQAVRTLMPLLLAFTGFVTCALAIAITNESNSAATAISVAAIGAGLLVGGGAGWWAAARARLRAGTNVAASRYVPRPRTSGLLQPDATALSHWPIAQVRAWSRPENSRYVVVVALMAVQGGSSAIDGLSVVSMYFVASYLAALLSATRRVAEQAAAWLRSTPMTLGAFVMTLSRRALTHQFIGTSLAVVCMALLGAPLGVALQVAALWLSLVVSITGFALVDNRRNRSPALKIAVSFAVVAALGAVMQLRAGAKA